MTERRHAMSRGALRAIPMRRRPDLNGFLMGRAVPSARPLVPGRSPALGHRSGGQP